MELIAKLWKNFKLQPEIWFFYGFILTFTLTIRKVLWFSPLRGEFNEYSGAYLYLSDIFLGLIIIAWIITILYNKIDILSMLKNVPLQKECSTPNLPIVPRGTLIYILLPLVLVAWSFISLIWAENKIVAILRSVKMLEFYLLYVFVLIRFFCWNTKNNVPRGTILKKVFGLIMLIGLFQAIIGIAQFVLQHSIGLFWLKESLISPDIAGVAKVIFNGETFIRTYGLFPHPNILGGFLLFSILVSLLYYRMSHARLASTSSLCESRRVEQLIKISLGIQFLALILTFSKSAIVGLFLGLIYFAYVSSRKECSTPVEMFHVEHSTGQAWNILRDMCGTFIDFFKKKKRLLIVSVLIIIFSVFILKPDWHSLFIKSLNNRSVYASVSRGTIWDNPILGIGSGQFVINMENMPIIKENWMLQPVHNVFLLVWSELGIVGFLILVLFIGFILKGMFHACPGAKNCSIPVELFHPSRNVPRGTFHGTSVDHSKGQAWNNFKLSKTFGAIFISLLFIMFFDHYLWDIQQGSFLLWMTMGFLVGAGECKENIDKI